jgi:hypothetical protein
MRDTSIIGIDSSVDAVLQVYVKSLPFVKRIVLGVLASVDTKVVDIMEVMEKIQLTRIGWDSKTFSKFLPLKWPSDDKVFTRYI